MTCTSSSTNTHRFPMAADRNASLTRKWRRSRPNEIILSELWWTCPCALARDEAGCINSGRFTGHIRVTKIHVNSIAPIALDANVCTRALSPVLAYMRWVGEGLGLLEFQPRLGQC